MSPSTHSERSRDGAADAAPTPVDEPAASPSDRGHHVALKDIYNAPVLKRAIDDAVVDVRLGDPAGGRRGGEKPQRRAEGRPGLGRAAGARQRERRSRRPRCVSPHATHAPLARGLLGEGRQRVEESGEGRQLGAMSAAARFGSSAPRRAHKL